MAEKIKIPSDEFEGIRDKRDLVVEDKITSHGRWSVGHTIIFKHGDDFYRTHYSVAATESQSEYEQNEYECTRVIPVEKIVTVYEEA